MNLIKIGVSRHFFEISPENLFGVAFCFDAELIHRILGFPDTEHICC